MEREFAALSEKERVARCLALAQSELERANACTNPTRKELHLSLADCWRSMAQQFETLSSLRSGTPGNDLRSGLQAPAQPVAPPQFDSTFPGQKRRFAT